MTDELEVETEEQLPLVAEEGREERLVRALSDDRSVLHELRRLAERVDAAAFDKYQRLLALLAELGIDAAPQIASA